MARRSIEDLMKDMDAQRTTFEASLEELRSQMKPRRCGWSARLFNFIASFANTLRTGVYGPDHTATFPGQTDEGDRAWREFQDRVARARAEAAAKHRPRRQIDAMQQAVVHAALKGGAK